MVLGVVLGMLLGLSLALCREVFGGRWCYVVLNNTGRIRPHSLSLSEVELID
jgi:hypothetical protein